MPGLKEDFLVGHVRHFLNKPPPVLYKTIEGGFRELGKVWKANLGHESLLLLADPKIVDVLLKSMKFIRKSSEYGPLRNWLGEGLVTSTGAKWSARRKATTPAFHFKILEDFVQVFDRNSVVLVEQLQKHTNVDIINETVDIVPFITLVTLDIICGTNKLGEPLTKQVITSCPVFVLETAMGVSIDAQKSAHSEYVQAIHE